MVNDSVRLDRIFANMSDSQIQHAESVIFRVVHITIGIALIVTGIIMILGRHHP